MGGRGKKVISFKEEKIGGWTKEKKIGERKRDCQKKKTIY